LSRRMARLERRVKKMTIIKAVMVLCLAVLALGFIYQLGVNTRSTISKLGQDIKAVEYGVLEDKLRGKAIVLRKEEVVLAESEGHFENMLKEKERTPKGSLLGYYMNSQGKTPLRAAVSGIFTCNTDGLEEVFRDVNLQSITPEVFKYKTTHKIEGQPTQAGQAVYKIVDSLHPTRLLVHLPLDEINFDVEVKQKVNIYFEGKDLGKAEIIEMKKDFGELLIIIEFDGFREDLLSQRYIEIEVVFDSQEGYIIPEKALIEREGKKGIYCLNGEDITFKPVNVIKTKDGMLIVKGLNENDMLLTNPSD